MYRRILLPVLLFLTAINTINSNFPAFADSSDIDSLIKDLDSQIQDTQNQIQKIEDDDNLMNEQIDYICKPIKEESSRDECKLVAMYLGPENFSKLGHNAVSASPKVVSNLGRSCQKIVPNRLKAPASTRFSDSPDINEIFSGVYVIYGNVDSQNSYGALLRASYFCYMRNLPKKGIELLGVEISEPGR